MIQNSMCSVAIADAECFKGGVLTTPDSRFSVIGNGSEVLDNRTKLIWQRCSIGQSWNGKTCVGEATKLNWLESFEQVSKLGENYRLPNIKELNSIVEYNCSDPAINTKLFPNTAFKEYHAYVTSTSVVDYSEKAESIYAVHFEDGQSSRMLDKKNRSFFVRAVRNSTQP